MSQQAPTPFRGRRLRGGIAGNILSCLALLIPGIVLFAPALRYPFLNLDDDFFVVLNPGIRELSWKSVVFLFLHDEHDFRYNPLTYLSFAIDYHFFGLDAYAFHRTNLILHLLNTALVAVLGFRLSSSRVVAATTALLFCLHPLQAEPAVWVMSRNNCLFVFFFLLSCLAYLGYREARDDRPGKAATAMGLSVALFALSCLAKTTAVTLPAVLLLVDLLQDRRPAGWSAQHWLAFLRREIPSKLAYVPVALVCTWMLHVASLRSPFRTERDFQWHEWATVAGHNFFFYVEKALAPLGLSVLYPLPDGPLPVHFYAFALASLVLLAACIACINRHRLIFFGLGWYIVTIAPMALLPLLSSDLPILAANRYFYPAAPGLFLAASVAMNSAWERLATNVAARGVLLAALMLAGAALLTRTHLEIAKWGDTISVLEQSAAAQPSDDLYYRLALEYSAAGRDTEASQALRAAEHAPVHAFSADIFAFQLRLSEAYRRAGDHAKAAHWMQRAIESTPNVIETVSTRCPVAYAYLADLYRKAGDDEAAARFESMSAGARCTGAEYFRKLWFMYAREPAAAFLRTRTQERPADGLGWYYLASYLDLIDDQTTAAAYRAHAQSLGFTEGDGRR